MTYAICFISSSYVCKRFNSSSNRLACHYFSRWLRDNIASDMRGRFGLYLVRLSEKGLVKYYFVSGVCK